MQGLKKLVQPQGLDEEVHGLLVLGTSYRYDNLTGNQILA
jgi:hypothetical protein